MAGKILVFDTETTGFRSDDEVLTLAVVNGAGKGGRDVCARAKEYVAGCGEDQPDLAENGGGVSADSLAAETA